ncbi:adenylate kinase-domain-containing protein [Chytriomyces sp. MP71]|nr:adenylate kinase-domain-containing protein [Chytriomyces sp. MP71]
MRTIVFFGAPGSGKGTLAARFSKHFDTKVVSTGDLLRKHVFEKTRIGTHVANILASGALVDDALVQEMLHDELASRQGQHLLLDGFPRTVSQARWLSTSLSDHARVTDAVVNLDVPERVILGRIEARWIHAPSGRTYNMQFNPPKVTGLDDVTGEKLSKRPDDDLDTFRARIENFKGTTFPVLQYYEGLGVLHTFQGETSDQLFPLVKHGVGRFFDKGLKA